MATYNKFNVFTKDLLEGKHQLGTHTLKAMFTNSAPVATNTVLANLTEITAQGGYSAGGVTLDSVTVTQVSGTTYKVTIADEVFTATGNSVGPFRYVVIYNDSQTSPADPLIAWYDYGSSVTLQDTETFTINFDDTNGLFQLG